MSKKLAQNMIQVISMIFIKIFKLFLEQTFSFQEILLVNQGINHTTVNLY